MFCRELVERLMRLGEVNAAYREYARLFLFAYSFLLRLPSEAVPAAARSGASRLGREGNYLVLEFERRKNKPGGSRLVRGCWCGECKATCPLNVLGPVLDRCADGERLFPCVTAVGALKTLREMLGILGVPRAGEYRTHDLRRGHAKDLQCSGGHVVEHVGLHGCDLFSLF